MPDKDPSPDAIPLGEPLNNLLRAPIAREHLQAHFSNLAGVPLSHFPSKMSPEFVKVFNELASQVDGLVQRKGLRAPDSKSVNFKQSFADRTAEIVIAELDRAGSPLTEVCERLKQLALREERKKFGGPSMVERMYRGEVLQILNMMAMVHIMQKFDLDPELLRLTPEETMRQHADFGRRVEERGGQLIDMVSTGDDPEKTARALADRIKGTKNSDGNGTLH